MTPQWLNDPEVQEILSRLAVKPPRRRVFHYRFGETEERFVGKDVQALNRIRARYMEQALRYDDLTHERTFTAEVSLTVDQAILNSIAAVKAGEMRKEAA